MSAEFLVLGQVSCCLALGLWQGSLGPVTKRIYKKGFSLSSHIIKDNILIRLLPLNCGALRSYPGPAVLNRSICQTGSGWEDETSLETWRSQLLYKEGMCSCHDVLQNSHG